LLRRLAALILRIALRLVHAVKEPAMPLYLALLTVLLAAEVFFSAPGQSHVPDVVSTLQEADTIHRLSCTPFLTGAGADSLLTCAKLGQDEFEKLRRRWSPLLSRPCDAKTRGYCILFMAEIAGDLDPRVVRETREELLAMLAVAAEKLPTSDWITKQRVRYLIEAGREWEAMAVVQPCRLSERWLCPAIAGYALHKMALFHPSQDSFDVALRAMPPDVRTEWTDISLFLDGDVRERLTDGSDQLRRSLARRFWWLADPFYLTSANDRWTEHLSRHVVNQLHAGTRSGFSSRWGGRQDEVVLRHGLPDGWVNVRIPIRTATGYTWMSYKGAAVYSSHTRRIVPRPGFLLEPMSIQPMDWMSESEDPLETYDLHYVHTFIRLEHQVSVFVRGDSAIIVAAYDQTADTLWRNVVGEVGLVLMSDERSRPLMIRRRTAEPRGVLIARVEARPLLMSFEFLSNRKRRAARARYGLSIRKTVQFVFSLSNLLITIHADPLPTDLKRASALARGSLRVKAGERLGLYWEGYGLGPSAELLSVAVSMHRVGKGRYGRLEEVVLEDEPPINLKWDEVVPASSKIWKRSMSLDLPDDLQPGLYVVYLVVKSYTREPVQQARALLVDP
jgi:hypothetical protein